MPSANGRSGSSCATVNWAHTWLPPGRRATRQLLKMLVRQLNRMGKEKRK